MNDATLAILAALGVHYDLTIEPGRKSGLPADVDARPSGGMPDYTDAPLGLPAVARRLPAAGPLVRARAVGETAQHWS
ncbi:hypothetical protein [Methylibium sp.]|uniref:hypothetical protein n=1 Tax=Methylibium sp. TaxID=2067992 RepID=UPI0018203CF0|nr:hypothetical protein [Methylibium sp.]MBA3588608.1 hypothetical protein [Methylibium sp.]